MHRLLSASAAVVAVAGLALAVPACSSSKTSGGSSSTQAPEDQLVSAADVAAGLAGIQQLNSTAALTLDRDQAGAKATLDQVETSWRTIEGTVKHNDVNAYLDFEDALGSLRNGVDQNNVDKATTAAAAFATHASTYLDTWPADGAATTVTTASATP